ncbi:class I adenylate-forming enzyme family protein [Zhongshania sp.]|jgi:long-chain acyl-CoA synthetase|uniref:class I adenylate-forming enzyme family protein n=1 Tax=Zhongshania sp. TaxID=1971902 RepID=UPI0039E44C96
MEDTLLKIKSSIATFTATGADFETLTQTVNGVAYDVYKNAPTNLRDLYQACLAYDDKTFLVYQDQRLSFRQTFERAAVLSAALAMDLGVRKGDRVAIAMRNNPEWILSFMAVTALGAVAVPMNAWWTSEELKYGLADSGARVVVVDQQRFDRIKPFQNELGLTLVLATSAMPASTDSNVYDFNDLANRYPSATMPSVEIAPDDDVSILYTSGSTGNPKGVVSTHRGIISSLMSWVLLGAAAGAINDVAENGAPPDEAVALLTVPLFHVTGSHSLFLLSIVIGRKLVMMYKWDPQEALALIERERITYVNGVPTVSQELLDAAEHSDRDLSSLRELYSAGAARPPEHVRRISEGFNLTPGSGYGLTETNAIGAVNMGVTYIQRPASVGIPSPSVTQIKILSEGGAILAENERGEICIKSPSNARGYWNNPEATAAAFIDGWFHTGDIGFLDENGMLSIVDRIKDIIIRGGENISCSEVEAAIYACPDVAEVAVFSLPDDRLGEIVAAVIYMKAGRAITVETLRALLEQNLASYKVPAFIQFSDLPLARTATDKIFKRQIKEQVLVNQK